MNEFDKVLPVDQPALEEQHNNIVGQGDGVVVELEGVGVGKGDGEYREKILCIESFNTFEIDMRMERNSRTARHLQNAGCQSRPETSHGSLDIPDKLITYLITLAGKKTIFKTVSFFSRSCPSSCSSWPG